ncbi:MAG: hypothetical protein CYPHOPRED_000870 [Cyphobasidiales sp. Tagirdzhanova-0007]|nr:MAG: hypothetical protein CYPHOPRED_000870 [Cyphobasidiales sp. Tagirdzhanova-0007]
MAPNMGKFNRTNISKSDSTIATILPTYYCLCGEYILVGNVELSQLARRPIDKSFVLRNYASDLHGPKHVYKINANSDKDAVYIHRQTVNGQNAFEKAWRRRCPRCELIVAYEMTDPRDKKMGAYTFVLAGALSEEQTSVPPGAFNDEPSAP